MKLRENVAVVIENRDGLILVGERRDMDGAWQLPQGGVDEGETPEEAMWRELFEETGIEADNVVLSAVTEPINYLFPRTVSWKRNDGKSFDGQQQRYFHLLLKEDVRPRESDEFSHFRWVPRKTVLEMIVEFKKAAYIEAFHQLFGEKEQ